MERSTANLEFYCRFAHVVKKIPVYFKILKILYKYSYVTFKTVTCSMTSSTKKYIQLCKNVVFIACILKVTYTSPKRIPLIIFVNKVWTYNVNVKETDSNQVWFSILSTSLPTLLKFTTTLTKCMRTSCNFCAFFATRLNYHLRNQQSRSIYFLKCACA